MSHQWGALKWSLLNEGSSMKHLYASVSLLTLICRPAGGSPKALHQIKISCRPKRHEISGIEASWRHLVTNSIPVPFLYDHVYHHLYHCLYHCLYHRCIRSLQNNPKLKSQLKFRPSRLHNGRCANAYSRCLFSVPILVASARCLCSVPLLSAYSQYLLPVPIGSAYSLPQTPWACVKVS